MQNQNFHYTSDKDAEIAVGFEQPLNMKNGIYNKADYQDLDQAKTSQSELFIKKEISDEQESGNRYFLNEERGQS